MDDLPAPLSDAQETTAKDPGALTDSQVENLLAAGENPFATRPPSRSKAWEPPGVESLQQALPQYEISALIARGGMGEVYKGTQRALKRTVAIKVRPPDMDDEDFQFAARFKQEAQAMAHLSHPNIVAVFDAGATSGGLLYFVMEFIEGTDAGQMIASEGRIEFQRATEITQAVCDALAFAHDEGIIHRDIKPSNVMIDRKGRVKVADFGLAKALHQEGTFLTGSRMAMGTPDFIAPEALVPGATVDHRADLYAIGVMFYQMLTGRVLRGRFDPPSGMVPQVGKAVDTIIDKALQTDPDQRYSTATEMKMALAAAIPQPAAATTASAPRAGPGPAARSRQPRPGLLILAIAALLGAASGAED